MIPINIKIDDIKIKNIGIDNLNSVLECINESKDNYIVLGRNSPMDFSEIEQRYLESLMNSLEFFCGIYLHDKLIGIIKGRIENKVEKELWILSYLFLKEYRNKGIGTKVLNIFEEHFMFNFSINKFCILIMKNNSAGQNFWAKNGYAITRITKSSGMKNKSEMVILEKKVCRKF